MSQPIMGTLVGSRDELAIDVAKLVRTRGVLQANSGAGKSWALRRILEQTYGHVPHIVIDVEDEFYTLREKYDYVLASNDGGDCPTEPRSARTLARMVLELNINIIIGIAELEKRPREIFVRDFLKALINAPKKLRGARLVVVDEAHVLCPEKGKGTSEATGQVIDLMARGRKRGLCGLLATQRISKLNKDALAEANNKWVGRTAFDDDMKRAGDELGMDKAGRAVLRNLDPGTFFVYGPALTPQISELKVGGVQTTHPEPDDPLPPVPAASKTIQAALKRLADLPERAKQEIEGLEQAKTEIKKLRRELTLAQRSKGGPEVEDKVTELQAENDRLLWQLAQARGAQSGIYVELTTAAELAGAAFVDIARILPQVEDLRDRLSRLLDELQAGERLQAIDPRRPATRRARKSKTDTNGAAPRAPKSVPATDLSTAQQAIVNAVAWWWSIGVDEPTRGQVAFVAGYKPSSGHFKNTLGSLRTAGLIRYPQTGRVTLTESGRAVAEAPTAPPDEEELHDLIRAQLKTAQTAIFDVVVSRRRAITREELAERAGYEPTSGHFKNTLGSLRSLGLVTYPESGAVAPSNLVMLEGS